MKIWNNKYTKRMQMQALVKLPVAPMVQIYIKNILTKEVNQMDKYDWSLLKAAKICNGIGNWLIPVFIRKFLTWLLPFVKFDIHDLNYYLGGNWKDRLKADYGLLKYSMLSIKKYFTDGKYGWGVLALILGTPVILLFFAIVVLLGWTSFNYLKTVKCHTMNNGVKFLQ